MAPPFLAIKTSPLGLIKRVKQELAQWSKREGMCKRLSEDRSFNLTEEELKKRLEIEDRELVNELYAIVSRVLYEENERQKQIDTKGGSSIAIIGLSTSLVFSLGGLLIEKIDNVQLPILGCPIPWLVFFYISTSITLLASMVFAYKAIRARSDWRWFSEADIFNEEVLKEKKSQPQFFKRYMIEHMWKLYKTNFGVNETKGRALKRCQLLFIVGLIELMPIIVIIGLYALKNGGVL